MAKTPFKYIGERVLRADGADKVRGRYLYLADHIPKSTLWGVLILSEHPNAIIKSVDTSAVPNGVSVITCFDVPDKKYNSGEWFPGHADTPDETLLSAHARHVGDRIALVMAENEPQARAAARLVSVTYELLSPVCDMDTAADSAHLLHEDGIGEFSGTISYGDTDDAFRRAIYIERHTITTPKVHHAAMEPHCVLAIPRPEGVIEIHTPCQIVFGVQHAVSQVLPQPLSKIRVIKANMGGTFGGKQEVVFEPLCAWAAHRTGRPVFITTNREETIISTRTRAATSCIIETALDRDGLILGRRFEMSVDAGAYLSGTKKVMMAMGKKASRLYRVPALDYTGRTVRTSTTPAGACRGYGSPQIHTITEIHTDLLCTALGLDPVEFRIKNLIHPFDDDPSGGANIGKARVMECLQLGVRKFGYSGHVSRVGRVARAQGFACCTHGNGYYKTIYHDFTRMSVRILEDGSVLLRTALHELGNGTTTAMAQIVAEVTGIDVSCITVTEGDTFYSSYDAGCQASRVVYVCGECARMAAERAVELLCSEASKLWDWPVFLSGGVLVTQQGPVSIGDAVREIMSKNRTSIDVSVEHRPDTNPGSFGVHFAQVAVDTLTGLVRVERYLAVHDIGQAINRSFVEGQIYGGVQMGIGMALCEEMPYRDGYPIARNFDKYHMINAPDMPDVDVLLVEDGEPGGPFGAKSIGEICTVPVSAAIVNAVNRCLGTSMTNLPLTPAKIVAALDVH